MSKNRIKSVKPQRRGESSFDPSLLGDPVAMKTGWDPASSGSTNIATHKLVEVSPQRLEFRATIKAYLASAAFLMIGMGFLGHAAKNTSSLVPGVIFFGIGALMIYFGSIPFVFDQREGYLWKGRKKPESDAVEKHSARKIAQLDDVHAIQFLYERVKSQTPSKGSRWRYMDTYEMNIVIGDGSRVSVVRHGDKERLLTDAAKLSIFLGKPIWNAT
jgi:hypothetical protein